ncbi:MAG TPA: hypothetical protein VFO76_04415, partial [Candidatus Kapabacteria bacterium]|nr:hypothetical protein [Candidatus Kapabacteria bacterium]
MINFSEAQKRVEYLESAIQTTVVLIDLAEEILSVEKLCRKIKWGAGVARSLVLRAYLEDSYGRIENSSKLYRSARRIAVAENLERSVLDCDYGLSLKIILSGNIRQAYFFVKKTLERSFKIGYTFRLAYCNLNLGGISQRAAFEEETLNFYENALSIARQNGYKKLESAIYDELSGLFLNKENYEVAERYIRKSAVINRQLDHISNLLKSEIRLVTILLAKNDLRKAKQKLEQIRKQQKEVGPVTQGTLLLCEARVSWKQKQYSNAEVLFRHAHTIFHNYGRVSLIANTYQQQCEMYLSTKNFKSAIKYASLSLSSGQKSQDNFLIAESYKLLYESNKLAGNPKQSLRYLEKYNETRKSNDLDLLNKRLEFIELKTDYEKQQAEIDEEKKKAEMLRLELEQKERELTEKTRHLIKQTEAVAQFRDDLRAILRRTPGDDPLVKDVKERLKSFPEEQLNWIEFDKL